MYSAEVWGTHEAKDAEVIHMKFCTCTDATCQKIYKLNGSYEDLEQVPFPVTGKIRRIKYHISSVIRRSFFPSKTIPKI